MGPPQSSGGPGPAPTDTPRVDPIRLGGHDLLDPEAQSPAGGEVVVVDEPLGGQQTQLAQPDLAGVVPETEATGIGDAVLGPVEHEPVQMVAIPVEGGLQHGVQVGDRGVTGHEQAAPDQRTDPGHHDPQLTPPRTRWVPRTQPWVSSWSGTTPRVKPQEMPHSLRQPPAVPQLTWAVGVVCDAPPDAFPATTLWEGAMATISPLPRRPPGEGRAPTYAHAVEAFLIAHDRAGAWSAGTAVKYRQSLAILGTRLSDGPTGASVAALDTPAGAGTLEVAFTAAFATLAPATRARHLAALRSALGWWRARGWLVTDPTAGWARPKITRDHSRALTPDQIAALWRLDVGLREKTLWR